MLAAEASAPLPPLPDSAPCAKGPCGGDVRHRRVGVLTCWPQPMMAALRRLGGLVAGELPQSVATAGINGRPGWMALFSSHPPLEERIAALQNR